NPSISRPPLEPADDNFDLEPEDYPPKIKSFLCRILSWFPKTFDYPPEIEAFLCRIFVLVFKIFMVAISNLIIIDSSTIMEETRHRWRFLMLPPSLRTTEYRDRVEPTSRIISRILKTSCVGYCPGFQNLRQSLAFIVG
nr:hypothetical protein [Tanacetum cinerariifolium]